MKTRAITILTMLMFTFTLTFAKDPQSSLSQVIKNKISFPSIALEKQIEGVVFAEFTVTADGKIEVVNCTSLQGELQTYVFQTLSEIIIVPDAELTGKIFLMRFDFKLS